MPLGHWASRGCKGWSERRRGAGGEHGVGCKRAKRQMLGGPGYYLVNRKLL